MAPDKRHYFDKESHPHHTHTHTYTHIHTRLPTMAETVRRDPPMTNTDVYGGIVALQELIDHEGKDFEGKEQCLEVVDKLLQPRNGGWFVAPEVVKEFQVLLETWQSFNNPETSSSESSSSSSST